jgi:hypothetical protein
LLAATPNDKHNNNVDSRIGEDEPNKKHNNADITRVNQHEITALPAVQSYMGPKGENTN